jgi:para-nitrobenzyl esterase
MIRWPHGVTLLVCAVSATAAPPDAGAWYDRHRDGHGLDLLRVGERYVGTFFTYANDGQPYWYALDGVRDGDAVRLDLLEFRAGAGATLPAALVARHAGAVIEPAAPGQCGDGEPRPGAQRTFEFRFNIDGEALRWCLEPLLPLDALPERALSGSWYAGEADSGWGVVSYFFGSDAAPNAFQTIYLYDADGRPRWAYAGVSAASTDLSPEFGFARGYCRACAAQPLQRATGGSARVRLVTPRNDAGHNRVSLDLRYPFGSGGQFSRSERPLLLLAAHAAPAGVAATREGLVRGTLLDRGLQRHLAVPFAAPPTGELRWRAPQPAPARTRALAASDFGNACPQPVSEGGTQIGAQGEDCLTLNLWSPQQPPAAPLPVFVWIHGGGFVQGSAGAMSPAGERFYDGTQLAAQGMVVVTLQYRLGPLGFISLREFFGEAADHPAAGNYGILDQVAALKWVRDNIAAFGGDPGRVTLIGQSAGATSVCALLGSPLAAGLFHRAVPMSSACPPMLAELDRPVGAREPAYAQGDRLLQASGCATAADRRACLRALSTATLLQLTQPSLGFGRVGGETFGLVRDGHVLNEAPGISIAAGRAHPVPLISGVTADELTTLLPAEFRTMTAADYQARLQQAFPQAWPQVLARYPVADYPSPWRAFVAVQTDLAFVCPARAVTLKHAAAGRPTWRYVYTHVYDGAQAVLGAYHGGDIPFVFGNRASYTSAEAALRDQWQRRLLSFARDGHPDSPGDAPWPRRTATSDLALDMNPAGQPTLVDFHQDDCLFWEQFVDF